MQLKKGTLTDDNGATAFCYLQPLQPRQNQFNPKQIDVIPIIPCTTNCLAFEQISQDNKDYALLHCCRRKFELTKIEE